MLELRIPARGAKPFRGEQPARVRHSGKPTRRTSSLNRGSDCQPAANRRIPDLVSVWCRFLEDTRDTPSARNRQNRIQCPLSLGRECPWRVEAMFRDHAKQPNPTVPGCRRSGPRSRAPFRTDCRQLFPNPIPGECPVTRASGRPQSDTASAKFPAAGLFVPRG
jgi:hypothetical protein